MRSLAGHGEVFMKLNEIRNNQGAHKHKHKVGRGSSSGLGKTSGRGVKGAKARTGTKVYGFEGGQMPLHMRIPKRGFNNIFANDFSEVNIGRLQKAIDEKRLKTEGKITEEVLRQAGLAHKSRDGVRLLGKGEIKAKLDIEVAGASAGAKDAIEKAGGSVTVTFKKKVYSNKKGEPGKRQKRRSEAAEKKRAARRA
jgi:large subunit ribosomal protein L15